MEFSKFPRNVTFWPYFEGARGRVARRIRESTKLSKRGGRGARERGVRGRRQVGGGSEKERERRRKRNAESDEERGKAASRASERAKARARTRTQAYALMRVRTGEPRRRLLVELESTASDVVRSRSPLLAPLQCTPTRTGNYVSARTVSIARASSVRHPR